MQRNSGAAKSSQVEGQSRLENDRSVPFGNPPVLFEPVFSANFIAKQSELLVRASRAITLDGMLEEERMTRLIEYMRDLHAHTLNHDIAGINQTDRTYPGLLVLIDQTIQYLSDNYHWSKTHPLVPALSRIKNNIQRVIAVTQPQFSAEFNLAKQQNQTSVAGARFEMAKDTCGILACLLWAIPEKIITLDNGCETVCGPTEALCAGPSLPAHTPHGDIYCNLWAPANSMRALHADLIEQAGHVDRLKEAPVRHAMR